MKARTLILISLAFLLASCSTLVRTRSVVQDFEPSAALKRDGFDAISSTLIKHGFEISLANERLGIINTTYRDLTSGTDATLNLLGVVSTALNPSGSYTSYSRSLSLSFQVTDRGYRVVPKLSIASKTTTAFKSDTSTHIEYPDQNSPEGRLVARLIREINRTLGISDSYGWEEKAVTVDGGDY